MGGGPSSPRKSMRVLFMMHVDWHWAKQRPHALAEELSSNPAFKVLVVYLPNWRRGLLRKNSTHVTKAPIPLLPFASKSRVVRFANRELGKGFISLVIRFWRPGAVVVPYPTMVEMLHPRSASTPVVYDCMDLATGFATTEPDRLEMQKTEGALVARATAVITSSEHLRAHVQSLGHDKVTVVRNGANPFPWIGVSVPRSPLRLGYFGSHFALVRL